MCFLRNKVNPQIESCTTSRGHMVISPCSYQKVAYLCPQCEEERFCKHDTAGGPNTIQKHHLLHHTSGLYRFGKPQSSTPQQVCMNTAGFFIRPLPEIPLINAVFLSPSQQPADEDRQRYVQRDVQASPPDSEQQPVGADPPGSVQRPAGAGRIGPELQ